jgi:hypothetical protein
MKITEIVEVAWIHVDDGLPVIPEDHFGISVLVVRYDSMDGPSGSWDVGHASYASTTDRNDNRLRWFEGIDKDFDFMELYYGPDDTEWGPTGDPVIYWSYMPKLPKNLIVSKK